ncbi:MAG: efflux RND transporter periplasmic adaptor subunit [Pseudomonadota bacterium]
MCTRSKRAIAPQITTLAFISAFIFGSSSFFTLFPDTSSSWTDTSAGTVFDTPVAKAGEAQASTPSAGQTTKWTCPMHPHYIADEFGPCPICGMDLVKLETGGQDFSAENAKARTAITIAPEVIQNMGVRLGKAERSRFGRSVRSYGIVHANERLQTEITARVEGWVEKLHVTAVGDEVKAGSRLFELYSPQLVVSQNDYLNFDGINGTKQRDLTQLRAFGVQPRAIALIERLKEPLQLVPFYAERDGVISHLDLKQGSYTKRGMILATIQDYSSVWLQASVAEKDLGFITIETPATITFPNLSGRSVSGKVDYIYPTVDRVTRTGQVRLVIDNSDGQLRPGSYADVSFEVNAQDRVAIPSEAILRSGEGKYVVVSLGQGRFEPRLIETGLVSGRWTEIGKGIEEGEEIVVSGQFLLDSESALRESFQKLQRLQLPLSLLKLNKTQFAMIDHFVDAAIYLHETLVDGYDPDPAFLDPVLEVRKLMWPRFKDTKLAFVLVDGANAVRAAQKAKSESEVQDALARLTNALRIWMLEGAPEHYKSRNVSLFTDKESGRVWVQMQGRPYNPYGRGEVAEIAWPASKPETGTTPAEPAGTALQSTPKASDADMKGSHNGQ